MLAALAAACVRASPPAPVIVIDTAGPLDPGIAAAAAFMRGMIEHHAQAMRMSHLVPSRSRSADVRTLAERIEVSQRAEIALMSRWLAARRQATPDTSHSLHVLTGHQMPGMLTVEEMRELAGRQGDAFDHLFLALMIRHHEGALTMVAELLARPGGVQDPEAYRFAADVDADQRAEIARMRRMLEARGSRPGASPR